MKLGEYFKAIKLKNLLFAILVLYFVLWLLDSRKATGIFLHLTNLGTHAMSWMLAIDVPNSRMIYSTQDRLDIFLATPNPELLKLRQGFYSKPAHHYIQIDKQGNCTARYSKTFQGKWLTPASILCPQVQALLNQEANKVLTIDIHSGCKHNQFDAQRRGWPCQNN